MEVILLSAGSRHCAVPREHVLEVMRPLSLQALTGAPTYLLGLAVVRGRPTPVVHLGLLLGEQEASVARWVTVRTGERQVALAVSAVEGLVSLETHAFEESAPLLGLCRDNAIAELATRDGQLVFLLETSRLVEKCPSVLPEGSP